MNLTRADQMAKAVLYEGYMLYPYRPSAVKNQQRWNFGVLYPQPYAEAQSGNDAWVMQTECLVRGGSDSTLEVRVRFLQLVARTLGELPLPLTELPTAGVPEHQAVGALSVEGRVYQPWQEAVEREIVLPVCRLNDLTLKVFPCNFSFPAEDQFEPVRDASSHIVGLILRQRIALWGTVELSAAELGDGVFRLRVKVQNLTPLASVSTSDRNGALLRSLASTHTVLGVEQGVFISSLDPPDDLREASAACLNVGTWPVLIGEEGQYDIMLSSPIILYDHPQIAAESSGDLFDGLEIDEILSLRIMTMTDDEKQEMRQSDDRARQLLERTEAMPDEQLMKMHGVLRGLRALQEEPR